MTWSKLALLAFASSLYEGIVGKDWESPEYSLLFRQPLPIPPVKEPQL